jgi:hypothetical protein
LGAAVARKIAQVKTPNVPIFEDDIVPVISASVPSEKREL